MGAPRGVLSMISAGAASMGSNGDRDPYDFVEHADRALYRAKNYGRDRVKVYGSVLGDRLESTAA
jgi:PleD family two-component response regulator